MNNLETNKNNISEPTKKSNIDTANQIISSFVGHEDEFKKFIESAEVSTASFFKDDDVVIITPNKKVAELTTNSVKVSDIMKKLKKELDIMSDNLKIYGSGKLREWNKSNDDTAASVRILSTDGDRTVMITVKNAYSIDTDKLNSIKKELGNKFDKTFTTNINWSVKNDKIKTVITIVKNALGKAGSAFIKEAFVETTTYGIKSRKDYEDLINSDISDDIKKVLTDAVKPQAPSITYPK